MSQKAEPSVRAAFLGFPVTLGFVALIDPGAFWFLGGPSVVLAILGLVWSRRRSMAKAPHAAVLLLTSVFVATAWSEPRWCCDATPYYIYLRSALFDLDFDFANEWAAFGEHAPPLTPTGRAINAHSIGPALLWTPFVLLAHAYVVLTSLLGLRSYASTGYSAPYLLATAAGTGAVVVAGIVALWRTPLPFVSSGARSVAVVLGLLSSILPYYTFVVPSVAHGAVFAASALFLFVWVRVEKSPSLEGWLTLAALLGVVSLLRWQAVVLGLMFIPLFLDAWRRRIGRWWWAPAAGLVSTLVFSPQLAAWWLLFGSPFAVPTRVHGMDWTSPHFVDVLVSADRGLFTWTPAIAIACLGWALLARAWPSFAGSAAAVFFATTWVNGGVEIWSGADAFGARRFDLLIPLWVVGFAAVVERTARIVERQPLIAPAMALALFALWNTGLIRLHRNGVFSDVAPFEEVAGRQAASVRRAAEDWLGWIAGPRGRNLAYKAFVGRYFYLNTGFDGRIDLTLPAPRFLSGGWSERIEQPDLGAFRFAGRSGACVKVPLEHPADLPVVVTARSAVEEQSMTFLANGRPAGQRSLGMEWTEVRFQVPAALLQPGENLLCLAFSAARRNERAAAVRLIQLP